uniref:PET100 cytochrome c oxidase chaperone n=2 Tax=Ornithorhynchus anatinus TaxID=9258 RepID=A0A6I8NVU0_ORNAN
HLPSSPPPRTAISSGVPAPARESGRSYRPKGGLSSLGGGHLGRPRPEEEDRKWRRSRRSGRQSSTGSGSGSTNGRPDCCGVAKKGLRRSPPLPRRRENPARTKMGVKLEVFRMVLYLSFPVAMFWISNQADYFEEYVIKRKREIYPPEREDQRKELEDFKERMRKQREEKRLQAVQQ